jgi:hypothetical protein
VERDRKAPGRNREAEIKALVIQNCNSGLVTSPEVMSKESVVHKETVESDGVVRVEYWSEEIEGGCIGNYWLR